MPFYLSVCILFYLFWSHSPLAYEVLMDVRKRREKGHRGPAVSRSLKVRRWELEEPQAPLWKNWRPLAC